MDAVVNGQFLPANNRADGKRKPGKDEPAEIGID
jgi:hypothetical protein